MNAKYITVGQAALAWSISVPRVRQWLAAGRIKGAQKLGRDWLIPPMPSARIPRDRANCTEGVKTKPGENRACPPCGTLQGAAALPRAG